MIRPRLLALCLSAGCAVKATAPAPLVLGPEAPSPAAWVGLLDTRPEPTSAVLQIHNALGFTQTIEPKTGRLDGESLRRHVEGQLADSTRFAADLSAEAVRLSEPTLAEVAARHPEWPVFVLLEVDEAHYDVTRWRRKWTGIAVVTGITVGLGWPFLQPWERAPLDLGVASSGTVHVYDRRTDTTTSKPVALSTSLEVRGIPWSADGGHRVVHDASVQIVGDELTQQVLGALP